MSAAALAQSAEREDRSVLATWRGRRVGAHRVVRHLGSGGMANVFLVQHVSRGTFASAKLLPGNASDHARKAFARETMLLGSLDHPNIVRTWEHGTLPEGEPYLIMEYVRGIDLATYLERFGRMPAPRALWIVRQIATALGYLHALGVVHRDIKPANVMIDPEANDPVKLLDFGIARRLSEGIEPEASGVLAGTPAYMAPEQARGEPVEPSMDDYALGALALELLTGEPPFPHNSALRLVSAAMSEQPRLPSQLGLNVPHLDEVMAKALAKQVHERYASCAEFVSALRHALAPHARSAAPCGAAFAVARGSGVYRAVGA